jgi:NADPH:quinone reductase
MFKYVNGAGCGGGRRLICDCASQQLWHDRSPDACSQASIFAAEQLMRAVLFDRYGDLDVLRVAEVPDPVPAAGQILVRIAASAVNPADHKWRSGMFAQVAPIPLPHIVGYDVAGTVVALGPGVAEFAIGDRVAALLDPITKGGYAEMVAVDAAAAARIPDGLDFAHAAAVPCAALTGAQVIDEVIQPSAGQSVLVTGATGSVGAVGMLSALRRGARVVAAVRARYLDAARALGATRVIALGEEHWNGESFDHVFDTVGGEAVARLCRHLRPGGLICTAATTPIDPTDLPAQPQFVAVHPDGARLRSLLADVAVGRIPITIARRLPLTQAAEAQRLVEAGGLGGKVILEP